MFHHRKGNALTGFDRRAPVTVQTAPAVIMPDAFGHMAVGFRQPVDLRDIKAQGFNFGQGRRGRGRACGKHLNRVIKGAALFFFGIDDHIEHNRCAAKKLNAFFGDGVINNAGGDIAAADQGAAQHRHHPSMVPAVAMKKRHNRHKHWIELHPPADHRAHGHQIGAAMMIDHALGPPRGAGCVVERKAFPFVFRHLPVELGIPCGQQVFIGLMVPGGRKTGAFVRHFDDLRRRALHLGAGRFGQV